MAMHSTMIKQVLDFNKKAFDDSFNAVVAVQDNAEKMARIFWEKSTFFPEEGQKVVGDWVATYKNGLEEFRANVDSRFKLVEDFLLNAADQMGSSFVHSAGSVVSPAAEVKKTVSRKKAMKKVGRKKTDEQK